MKDLQSMMKFVKSKVFWNVFLLTVIMFLLKAYVVQLIYNQIWPVFISNSGLSTEEFRPITYSESLLLVILFRFLF